MSYILDERKEYLKNPYFTKHEYGDYTAFYVTISICSIVLGLIFILNIVFCCSRHRQYWQDRHTGNRWIQSLWVVTPHNTPPLDLSELESGQPFTERREIQYRHQELKSQSSPPRDYLEMQKRESEI